VVLSGEITVRCRGNAVVGAGGEQFQTGAEGVLFVDTALRTLEGLEWFGKMWTSRFMGRQHALPSGPPAVMR
jgi:hypothetical protein